MKNREALCKKLDKQLKTISLKRKDIQNISANLLQQYSLPVEISNDYLTLRHDIAEGNDFVLFIFASALFPNDTETYFSAIEIKEYSQAKYKVKKAKFPLRYKMVKVEEGQYIGRITAQDIIDLREAQLLNYNEETQRTLQRIIVNGVEKYRISTNKVAVDEIAESMKDNMFIPNTITLNLPEDANIKYEEETMELVISSTPDFKFDLLDGFHRYLAISQNYNLNHDFNYNMELRIVEFPESRAKQFIFQEDQKTKMRKVDSASMNQTAIPTKIISRLNGDAGFNLAGDISSNAGIINHGWLHLCLNALYVKGQRLSKANEVELIKNTEETLKEKINYITEHDENFSKPWDRKQTIAVVYSIYKDTPNEGLLKRIKTYYDALTANPKLLVQYREDTYSKADFRKLDLLSNEGGEG